MCCGLADRDSFHDGTKIRVDQGARNGHGNEHIGVELFSSGGSHHDGQEVERTVTDGIQDLIGLSAGGQHTCHAQQHDQQLDHGTADDGGDQRRHGANDGIQNVVADLFQGQRFFLFALGDLAGFAEITQLQNFVIGFFHMVANDDLILAALIHHTHHTVNGFDSCIVDLAFVLDHEPQTGHAVGHAGDVLHAANVFHDLLHYDRVISCHFNFLLMMLFLSKNC